ARRYGLADELRRFTIAPGSSLAGATLGELRWPELLGVRVIAVDADPVAAGRSLQRRRQVGGSKRIGAVTRLEPGDGVPVLGPPEGLAELAVAQGLDFQELVPGSVVPSNLVFAEVLVPPRSRWHDKTLAELRFRDRYRLVVLAVQRAGERLSGDLS